MDKLLDNFSINEIAKITHISPLSLERLFNYEFEKLDKIKVKGFIKILETEYPDFDFSELKERFEEYSNKEKEDIIEVEPPTDNKKMYVLVVLILLLIGVVYFITKNEKEKIKEISIKQPVQETVIQKEFEINTTQESVNNVKFEMEENNSKNDIDEQKVNDKKIDDKVVVLPLEKVWFKVVYLDNNYSKEYLTSHEVDLNGSKRIFIKFGHGLIKLIYNNKVIEPNTKKITRIIIENGDINITKKRLKDFQ